MMTQIDCFILDNLDVLEILEPLEIQDFGNNKPL